MFAERHAEFETRIKTIAIHFAHVVVDPTRAEHRAGDAGVIARSADSLPTSWVRAMTTSFERIRFSNSSRNRGNASTIFFARSIQSDVASTRHPPKRM